MNVTVGWSHDKCCLTCCQYMTKKPSNCSEPKHAEYYERTKKYKQLPKLRICESCGRNMRMYSPKDCPSPRHERTYRLAQDTIIRYRQTPEGHRRKLFWSKMDFKRQVNTRGFRGTFGLGEVPNLPKSMSIVQWTEREMSRLHLRPTLQRKGHSWE